MALWDVSGAHGDTTVQFALPHLPHVGFRGKTSRMASWRRHSGLGHSLSSGFGIGRFSKSQHRSAVDVYHLQPRLRRNFSRGCIGPDSTRTAKEHYQYSSTLFSRVAAQMWRRSLLGTSPRCRRRSCQREIIPNESYAKPPGSREAGEQGLLQVVRGANKGVILHRCCRWRSCSLPPSPKSRSSRLPLAPDSDLSSDIMGRERIGRWRKTPLRVW
jgi:hypothetical protein